MGSPSFVPSGNKYRLHMPADRGQIEFRDTPRTRVIVSVMTENSTTVPPSAADIRAWANASGYSVGARGRISTEVKEAYAAAHTAE
jgi:hypothetical protein